LLVIVLASSLEDILNRVLAAVRNLQVKISNPNVKLLSLLADVDALDGSLSNLSCLWQLADLHLERHVSNPQL
jgi:hypothetical protein